jgi:anti-sigma regulatory factor (Ser/Thr protein kinase)
MPRDSKRSTIDASRVMRLLTNSRPEALGDARRQVSRALVQTGLGRDAVAEMEIAAGEVLSNTHLHAYPSGIGPVFIEVFCATGLAAVIVIDHGAATTTIAVPEGQPSVANDGGRGLYLTGHLTDDVKIRVSRIGHGLAVLIAKSLEPEQTLAA